MGLIPTALSHPYLLVTHCTIPQFKWMTADVNFMLRCYLSYELLLKLEHIEIKKSDSIKSYGSNTLKVNIPDSAGIIGRRHVFTENKNVQDQT